MGNLLHEGRLIIYLVTKNKRFDKLYSMIILMVWQKLISIWNLNRLLHNPSKITQSVTHIPVSSNKQKLLEAPTRLKHLELFTTLLEGKPALIVGAEHEGNLVN